MEVGMNQALVVLGEYALTNRLLEDERDDLGHRLIAMTEERDTLSGTVEAMRSEKGILMLDIDDLRKQVDELKEAGNAG